VIFSIETILKRQCSLIYCKLLLSFCKFRCLSWLCFFVYLKGTNILFEVFRSLIRIRVMSIWWILFEWDIMMIEIMMIIVFFFFESIEILGVWFRLLDFRRSFLVLICAFSFVFGFFHPIPFTFCRLVDAISFVLLA
jgi:hypothetical protein